MIAAFSVKHPLGAGIGANFVPIIRKRNEGGALPRRKRAPNHSESHCPG